MDCCSIDEAQDNVGLKKIKLFLDPHDRAIYIHLSTITTDLKRKTGSSFYCSESEVKEREAAILLEPS